MALTFPSSPANGATSGEYTYDSAKGAWRKNAAYPVSVTHSDVAPSNPRVGDQWWKSNEGTLFTYYNDGTSSQWVESTNVVSSSDFNPIPAGAMMAWASNVIPANWLLCDGSAVSRSTYASLFASIGTTYGSGDGTTTFNVPNLKGRTIVGKDSTQTEFDALAETGGTKTHTLILAEMPAHTHGTVAHSHTFSGTTSTDGSHTHGFGANQNGVAAHATGGGGYNAGFNNQGFGEMMFYRGMDAAGSHTHTYSGTTSNSSPDTQSVGSGSPHNNLQPYIVLNYIIKFSVGETPGDSQLAVRVGTLETQNNATPLSSNYFINGALDFWQRSTSAAQAGNSNGFPSADRIRVISAGGSSPALTLARSTDVPAGVGAQYSGALSWSSNISGGDVILHQGFENGKFLFAGKTITVSFYAKAATAIQSKFDFDQDYGETFFNLTTSWARYSYTITLPSNYGTSRPGAAAQNDNVEMRFIRFTSISSASNTIYFTGLQVEEGPYATPFKRSAASLQAEFASCQRYYQRISGDGVTVGAGAYYIATRAYFSCTMPEMRAVPTITASSQSAVNVFSNANSAVSSSLAFDQAVSSTKTWEFNAITSTRTAGDGAWARINGSAYFEFSAEI